MNYREARKIARRAEHAFRLPHDATIQLIHEKLERKRGRTITVAELPELAGEEICGIWLICKDRDIILHAPTQSDWH
ncbi:hypothetical protein SB724_20015, partial [Bacillus sp. SIMBA_031]